MRGTNVDCAAKVINLLSGSFMEAAFPCLTLNASIKLTLDYQINVKL